MSDPDLDAIANRELGKSQILHELGLDVTPDLAVCGDDHPLIGGGPCERPRGHGSVGLPHSNGQFTWSD